jgi:hypothetical protein
MLTCIAVVLNIGPFAKAPQGDGLHAPTLRQAARIEQPLLMSSSGSAHAPAGESIKTAMDVAESVGHRMELSSVATIEHQEPTIAEPLAPAHEDGASPELAKKATFVGVWAPDAATCSARNFREGLLPAVINSEGAWAGETFCVFKAKSQSEAGWRVTAQCSNPRERWTANIRLTVAGDRLTWTSKRGTQAYTRCDTDVLMAAR